MRVCVETVFCTEYVQVFEYTAAVGGENTPEVDGEEEDKKSCGLVLGVSASNSVPDSCNACDGSSVGVAQLKPCLTFKTFL